jgi:hypothetical protein
VNSTSDVRIRVPAQADRTASRGDVADEVQLRVRHVYAPEERPSVLVHVQGEWRRGELRKWSQDPTGAWWGSVAWGRSPGARFLGTFPAERIWEAGDGPPPGT